MAHSIKFLDGRADEVVAELGERMEQAAEALEFERAAALHVVNRAGLRALIETTDAPVGAMSGYGLCVASPAVEELPVAEQKELRRPLRQRYRKLKQHWPAFGQAHTRLDLFVLKAVEEPTD